MPFHIEEAADADIKRFSEVEHLAYSAHESLTFHLLFPGPPNPDGGVNARTQRVIEMRNNDPTTILLKVVDEATRESMAFAKWNVYDTTEIARNAPGRPVPNGPGCNLEACEAFYGGLVRKKKELMGEKPHLWLHLLHTDPKYQKRGAASALIKWGTKKADELDLPVYLESSLSAHKFYHKHGFKDVGEVRVDMGPFGGEGLVQSAPVLIREPVKTTA